MSFDRLRLVRVCLVLGLLLSVFAGSARAVERIDLVSRVSPELFSATGGAQSTFPPNGFKQTVSADGRYIVFVSSSTNLVPGQVDDNGTSDIFLYDRVDDVMRLVSRGFANAAVTSNGNSSNPSISADGRYVAFTSQSTNISAADGNAADDVFLFDRDTGTNTLISHATGSSSSGSGASYSPMISADGNWVVFVSLANNLVPAQVPDFFGYYDVYIWERAANTNTMISHAPGDPTTGSDNGSNSPVLSADGSWVAYQSFSSLLVDGVTDFNSKWDAYLWERATDTNRLVSRSAASATTAGNGTVSNVRISADGASVLFLSDGTDYLVDQTDTNTGNDAFLWSRATDEIALASRSAAAAATAGNGAVVLDAAVLSADGNWVAFTSAGTDHVTGQIDTNATEDVFLWGRSSGTVELLSRQAGTAATASASTSFVSIHNLDISADGAFVAFVSRGTQIVAGQADTNMLADLFLFERATGTNKLVSGAGGSATAAGNGGCRVPVFSADGQWVGFYTTSSDIAPGVLDANSSEDVLLHRRSTGATTLVSRRDAAIPSETAGGPSLVPQVIGSVAPLPLSALSADGRYLVFQSAPDLLIPGQVDRNASGYDVFLHDRQTGTTTLVSRANGTTTTTGNGASQVPVISADGRYVAFVSRASNLVAGQVDGTTTDDVFLWDRQTGALTLVSHTASSLVIAAGGSSPVLSADGSAVVFISSGNNLVTGQSDSFTANPDIFLFDRTTGANTLVSHRSTGAAVAAGNCSEPWISADGRFAAFLSTSSIVVAGQSDSNGANDLFLWDRTTGAVILASNTTASATTAAGASAPAMSTDGNWLAFSSTSNAVISGLTDTNSQNDIFLWERATGTKLLVSRTATSATTAGNLASQVVMLSADGSRAVFLSRATNLVTGTDTNSVNDVFVFDRTTGQVALASHTPASATTAGNAVANRVAISADGSLVTFLSAATNLVSGQTDTANSNDLFRYDPATGAVGLLSRRQSSASAAAGSAEGGFPNSGGDVVAFNSSDNKIVPNDHNGRSDVFLWSDETLADLSITKTDGVASAVPGQALTYTITATNAGPTPVTGATVTDSFPAELQGVSWTCAAAGGASCVASGSGSLSQLVDLPVGGTVTFTVTATVAADATGTLANTASIAPPAGVTDLDGTDNSATDTDTLAPQADLAVSMTDAPDPVERGATLTWLISVTNAGPSAAASVTVTDTLPSGVTFGSATGGGWSCGEAGGVVTCTRPSLAPGNAPDLTIQVTAPVARGVATLTNTVAVTAATADPVANNGASTETSVPQPGITVTPVSGLTTTEAGGEATFTVVLDNPPLADVTIALTSGDTGEGTVSPASLTFTTGTWSTPQTVTVTGVNDDEDDGTVAFTIATGAAVSTDAGYAGIDPADVAASNEDDDTAGFTVTPTAGLTTTEAGGTATFTVVLQARPTADVTIALTSDDTGEGTVSPASLTFTPDTWNTPQTVTVTGEDDDLVDGDVAYTLVLQPAESSDPAFDGLDPADVAATNEDDDTAGIEVTPTSGLVTTEGGGTATFTVTLTAQPTADVTIAVESSDPGEGLPSPTSLTFTTGTWNTPQTVTVTGVDDDLADGDIAYTLVLQPAESSDDAFDGLDPADVSAVNQDDGAEGVYHAIIPCRAVDTRQPGFGPALDSGQVATVQMRGVCGIPATAHSVAVNLTYTGATQPGELLIYPGDLKQPPLPEFQPVSTGRTRALALVMPLGADGTLALLPMLQAADPVATIHVILDVSGYFE